MPYCPQVPVSFFTTDATGALVPTDVARSAWGPDHVHGVAVAGSFARAAEQRLTERPDLRPARLTVDLFRPARMQAFGFEVEVVRESRRLCLVDLRLVQDDGPVARASVLFLQAGRSAPGEVWTPGTTWEPPPDDLAPPTDEPRVPFVRSSQGWSQNFGEHQNGARKVTWSAAVPIVAGEKLSPFQAAASVADGASLATNWGTGGVEHINTDITLALARRPVGTEIGLGAIDRVESDGIAVGTVAVFDRAGPLGNVMVTALANADKAVDFTRAEYDDDGTRRVGRQSEGPVS